MEQSPYKGLTVEELEKSLGEFFRDKKERVDDVIVTESPDNPSYYEVKSRGFYGMIPKEQWHKAIEKAALKRGFALPDILKQEEMNIRLIEPMTKENLWNELQEKYPIMMKKFCDFIDEYKRKVRWDEMFGATVRPDWTHFPPKFHDLPFEMQVGIYMSFVFNTENVYQEDDIKQEMLPDVYKFFAAYEEAEREKLARTGL